MLSEGIHSDIPMAEYVADPAPAPSLSTGVVRALTKRSPQHARLWHPRLGGLDGEGTSRGDLGSAIHSLVLGGPPVEYVSEVTRRSGKEKGVPFVPTDWKTQDARDAQDEIRARGAIPLLELQRATVETAARNAREVLASFGAGKAEQTMIWQQGGVWCRGRADFITDDGKYDIDLKTCDNADPATWIVRNMVPAGYDIQAALRIFGHEKLSGRTRDALFLLVEIEPPYGCSIVGVGPSLLDLARRKVERAIGIWRQCLSGEAWPGYGRQIHWAEAPAFAEWDFEARSAA